MSVLLVVVIFVGAVLLAVVPLALNRYREGRVGVPTAPPGTRRRPPRRPVSEQPGPASPPVPLAEAPLEVAEAPPEVSDPDPAAVAEAPSAEVAEAAPGLRVPLARPRFRDRLAKARTLFAGYVGSMLARDAIDASTWQELEEALIRADVGVGLSASILDDLRGRVAEERIASPQALVEALEADLEEALSSVDRTLHMGSGNDSGAGAAWSPTVWLFVGVNGVGKTTTIGKIGFDHAARGYRVVMAAGDTFRAAAADQLETWAERAGADLVRGAEGGDPASVVFDAIQHAASRHADLVLADTAGRLHTKVNLMEELRKVHRVASRPPGEVTEVLLVIDATTGQNGLVQAKEFADAVGVTGIVLTKLDGTAKGGIVLAIQRELGLPIKLVGLGEAVEDLVEFDPHEFVEALLAP